jgi:hypothetical protein
MENKAAPGDFNRESQATFAAVPVEFSSIPLHFPLRIGKHGSERDHSVPVLWPAI